MEHNKQVALITGASSGIGKALAVEFANNGYTVFAAGRNEKKLEELKKIQGITTVQFDITNYEESEIMIKKIIDESGGIDVLVNNAGYGLIAPIIDVTRDELARQFETNLFAQLELTRKVVPSMKEKGSGLIVNIGSISGVVTTPFAGAYCASKAAFHSISDALRMELSPFGIKVITVKPGGVKSDFGDKAAEVSQAVEVSEDYKPIRDDIIMRAKSSQINAMPADKFARRIVKIIKAGKTPPEIFLGTMSFLLPLMKKVFSIKTLDNVLNKRFGINKLR